MNMLSELFKKRCEYLLKDIPKLVSEKYECNWLYRKDKPVKKIKKLLIELKSNGDLTDGEKNLDEIIAICTIWKHSFIDWDVVQKEENKEHWWKR